MAHRGLLLGWLGRGGRNWVGGVRYIIDDVVLIVIREIEVSLQGVLPDTALKCLGTCILKRADAVGVIIDVAAF
jgi:hypothetical protein